MSKAQKDEERSRDMLEIEDPIFFRDDAPSVGYWPSDRVTWPIDRSWDPTERDAVVAYLLAPTSSVGYRGSSRCRVCGCVNGSKDYSDGTFVWPSGLAHYLIEHWLRPPDHFVAHVLKSRVESNARRIT